MDRIEIPIDNFIARSFNIWNSQWFLLSAGDFASRNFNSMTVSWGSFGTIWNKPFAMVVVRPQRYTLQFMEKFDNFSLSAFPDDKRKPLDMLGSKSGRTMDKINASGYTPAACNVIASPSYEEAELVIECRKMYFGDLDPKHFLDQSIHGMYRDDYHRMYFGEVLAISGAEKFSAKAQA